jgi:hypothetical protein
MSHHVYIAREGFKDNPIGIDEWERAVQACQELRVEATGRGRFRHLLAKLPGDPRVWLSRTPYGLIQTQNPNIEMIRVMFRLASELGAAVYSDRLDRYGSVEDWEQRTAEYRRGLGERREVAEKKRRTRVWLVVLALVAFGVLGVIFAVWFRQ